MKKKAVYIVVLLSFSGFSLMAQCTQFYNGAGVASSKPYWIGCSGGNFTIFVQPTISILGGYTINWGDGTANSTGVNLIPPAFISHTYTAIVDTFPVIITTTSPACTINGVVVMEITPSASIQIPLGSPIYGCTPATFNFKNASTNISKTTKFTWTFGDGSAAQIFNYTNVGQILNHTYLPGTGSCNVAITLKAENYCNKGIPSVNVYQPIQVWDKDIAGITPDALIKCSPSNTFHFNNTTSLNCSSLGNNQQRYEYWDFGDYWGLGHDSIINWQPFSPPNRAGYDLTYPGIGTYSVLLKDSSFCGLAQKVITVKINAPPVANLSLSLDSICKGQSITATNLSTGTANQFIWDFGDGTAPVTVSTTAAQTHTYNTVGTFTVSLIANISGASGCTSTASKQVKVKPTPTADFNLGANNFCDAGTETFSNISSGAIASYSWAFGNGNFSSQQNPVPETYTGAATYNVVLNVTGTNGCGASKTKQVKVYPIPNSQISPFSVCKGLSGTFADASTTAIGNPLTSWLWNFGDGTATSGSQNPAHTYANSGSFKVKLTVTTAFCSNIDSISATVNPLPVSSYSKSVNSGCTPLIISFTNQSTGASTYTWNFGDGTATSTAVNPNHTFTNPQSYDTTYTITLTAVSAFGCIKTFSSTITVFHAAHASFTSDYLINCSPLAVQFTNTSTGTTGYSWDFGDGSAVSTSPNPYHVFANNTSFSKTYIATLTVSSLNGCTNTAVQNILVYPKPNFTFIGLPADTGCAPLNISFNAASGGAVYQWNFGDGSTSVTQSPNHTFINNGILDSICHVQLITTSPFSCNDTANLTVLIHPNPKAVYTKSASLGCSPLTVNFTDNSIISNSSLWDFGDGNFSTAVNPTHTFINSTSSTIIYRVTLQVKTTSGCIDTMIRPVEVFPKVTAAFVSPTSACSPLSMVMTNFSNNATIYNWNFGDGFLSSQTNPSHIYINPGSSNINYTITLHAQSSLGCTDSATSPLTVFYKPDANFNLSSNAGCPPFPVNFNNVSVGAFNNDWVFGDGGIANGVVNTSHTYLNVTGTPTTNNVSLIVTTTNSCKDTMMTPVVVYPKVISTFTGQADGCSPLNIVFGNQSTNADSYSWNLGDGTQSSLPSFSKTYINNTTLNKNLNITLTASSSFGCSDSMQKPISVFYKPFANFNLNSNSGCHPLSISFSDQSIGAIHYFWNFGDGSPVDTTISPSHIYTNLTSSSITFVAKLKITTNSGCSDSIVKNITVFPHVVASFIGVTDGCSPLNINLTNQSTNTNTYNWLLGDGAISTQTNPSHTYSNNTTVNNNLTITLTATSNFGCSDSLQKPINVFYKPYANFNLNSTSGCHPLNISFSDQSSGGIHYFWNFGDGSPIDTTMNPSHIYTNFNSTSLTFVAKLKITTNSGCSDSIVKNITVFPHVVAAFVGEADGCSPLNINLTNQSTNTITYNWNFGDGSLSTQTNPSHTYSNNTTVNNNLNIILTATSNFGCSDSLQKPINVFYKPNANFNISAASGCHPLNISFADQSSGGIHYFWNFGDGSPIDTTINPSHIYTNFSSVSLTYVAKLKITTAKGCVDSITKNILVFPHVIAAFTGVNNGCSPLLINLTNQSTNTITYSWDLGDGTLSTQSGLSHTYINNSSANINYTILLTATSSLGCVDTQTAIVNVKFKPDAVFSTNTNAGCSPLPVAFTNQSTNALTHQWNFGDNSPFESLSNASHLYINGTSSTLTNTIVYIITANNGCSDTATNSVAVYPKVTASFSCPLVGCSPYTALFTNGSTNATTYLWDFGNGSFSSQATPSNTYVNSTTSDQLITIQLIASSNLGCADTTTNTTTVGYQPIAAFSATPVSQTYPSAEVSLINTTNTGTWNYSWTWGDSNTSSNQSPPPNTYATWGIYNIKLIVTSSNCSDTVSHSITIIPPLPIASFTIPAYDGCEPEKICFENNSQYTVTNTWEFGDGNTSSSQNPCYTFFNAGTFNVKLTATGPGGQTDIANSIVNIYPKPRANFSATPTLVQIPNTQAEFFNLSIDADTYLWDFGEGGSSTAENPSYAYNQVGQFDVTLIATNQYGCIDTITKPKYIRAELINGIVLPNAFTPNPLGSNGGVYDPTSYNNDVFFPFTVNGIDEYRLTIYNKWGEIVFDTRDLKVGWDGFYRGSLCQPDVYIYKVKGTYLDGTSYMQFGDVTLLR